MSIGDYQHLPLDETGNYTQHISNGNGKLKPLLFAEAQLVVLALDLAGGILVTDEFDLCNAKGHLGFHLENPWRHERVLPFPQQLGTFPMAKRERQWLSHT